MSGSKRDKDNSGRVHITYNVFTGDAREERELPFVVGVIGDFGGAAKLEPFGDRRFIPAPKVIIVSADILKQRSWRGNPRCAATALALQLLFMKVSESMGNHDS